MRGTHPTEEHCPALQAVGINGRVRGWGTHGEIRTPGSSLISVGLLEALHWVKSLAHSRCSIHACRRRTRNLCDLVESGHILSGEISPALETRNWVGVFPGNPPELWRRYMPSTLARTSYMFRVHLHMDALSPTACKAEPTWQKPFLRPGGACNPSQGCRAGGSGSTLTAHSDQPSTLEVGPLKDSH